MSTTDNPNPDALPGGDDVASAGGGNGSVADVTLSLVELNQFLGKNFGDKETALKALKDTQSFVGKRKEDIEKEVRASIAGSPASSQTPVSPDSKVRSLEEEVFYLKNPQYKGYENIIRKMGSTPAEVVDSEEFKTIFENGKAAAEVAQRKSVVSSSPRLAQQKTVMEEAVKIANATHSKEATADVLAAAIREELETA